MPYQYAIDRPDYSDYASGHVLYGRPHQPALPVRLTSEIFQRCLALRAAPPRPGYCVYDPCCGGAYHLCTLAYLHWNSLATLIGSDIDAEALRLAKRNFSLLTLAGLQHRRMEIAALAASYGKASHQTALAAADRLEYRLRQHLEQHSVKTQLFQADSLNPQALQYHLQDVPIDFVITDLPYGQQAHWLIVSQASSSDNPVWRLLNALREVLSPFSVVAIVANKQQKIAHEQYRRVEHFRLGKRQVVMLQSA